MIKSDIYLSPSAPTDPTRLKRLFLAIRILLSFSSPRRCFEFITTLSVQYLKDNTFGSFKVLLTLIFYSV